MLRSTPRRASLLASLTAGAVLLGTVSLTAAPTAAASAPETGLLPVPDRIELPAGEASPRLGEGTATGRQAFLLELDTRSTSRVFAASRFAGRAAAGRSARTQLSRITAAQADVVEELPRRTPVLYRTHAALAGVAVLTDAANVDELAQIPGVAKVHPISPKHRDNSYAVGLQGAPAAWEGDADLGADITVGIIDSGIDFTHATFGGLGTKAAYDAEYARSDDATLWPGSGFPNAKVVGGWDLVGNAYNASGDPFARTPRPDPNPLDCGGHGSHVAGSAAGLGVTAAGAPYAGAYDSTTDLAAMRVGPGMAPRAKLMAFRVFGCNGTTNMAAMAIDRALDPNRDGLMDDAVDVMNLSLGSPYGSAEDGDAVVADAAAAAGVTMVFSSGNTYDLYDVGGSPGTSRRGLTVAASVDAQEMVGRVDLTYSLGGGASMGASRAISYNWAGSPDLTGEVVIPAGNTTGCTPFTSADAAAIAGKVALLSFGWNGAAGDPCGSAIRANHVAAAGGIGYVFASTNERFPVGITGNPTVPGVMVNASDSAAIRTKISAGNVVTVGGTGADGFAQRLLADDDTMTDFSSRGTRGAGHLKPDVTAVGGTVFSAAVGSGGKGMTLGGTSMAAPMVAGLAALVRSAHPTWSPEQVKANIMNTAGQDLDTNGSRTDGGDRYAPNRVGAGRIDAEAALENDVLAYVTDDPGAVSVSFGPVEVTEPVTMSKTVHVENTGSSPREYTTSYDAITTVPGVDYEISPGTVDLDPGEAAAVTVTLTIDDPTTLTKTVDATHGRVDGTTQLDYLADASGNLLLTPAGAAPELRVPVYSAPRPASAMTQPDSLPLTGGTGTLTLDGQDVDQGIGAERVRSLVTGLELQHTSPRAPACGGAVVALCVSGPTDRGADIEYVGVTSDAPSRATPSDGQAYFGISTHGARSTAANKFEFQVYLDTDADGDSEAVAYTTRVAERDTFVTTLLRMPDYSALGTTATNNRLGDVDTAIYDSDVLLMPVLLDRLVSLGVDAGSPRVRYGVVAYADRAVDKLGFGADGKIDGSLSANLYEPGVRVTGAGVDGGAYSGNLPSGPLVEDRDGADLTVTRNDASYADDRGQGLLMLHFHNEVGNKAQVVVMGEQTTTTLGVSPSSVVVGQASSLTVTVDDPADAGTPTGTVSVTDTRTSAVVATGPLTDGSATLTHTPTVAGTQQLVATYAGDEDYAESASTPVSLTVTAPTPPDPIPSSATAGLTLSPASVERGTEAALEVDVAGDAGRPVPTGTVSVRDADTGTVLADGTLTDGAVTLRHTPTSVGTRSLVAAYAGDSTYAAATSPPAVLTVTPAVREVTLDASATSVVRGGTVSLTVGVERRSGDPVPTGAVALVDAAGATVASGILGASGTAMLTLRPARPGRLELHATYAGDRETVAGGPSQTVSVKVEKARAGLALRLPDRSGKAGVRVRARVAVATVLGIPATGRVVLKAGRRTLDTATLARGRATFAFTPRTAGRLTLRVVYAGDPTYGAGSSGTKIYTVKPRKPKR